MKILNVSSFQGNIGDNASFMGLKSLLTRLKVDITIDKLEIRRFYQNYLF